MPAISLPTFVYYSAGSGSDRITTVQQQRRMYDNPEPHAYSFYRRPANAIRAGRASGQDEVALTILVGQARPVQYPHYLAIAEGWLRCVEHWKPEVVEVGQARWACGDLEVRISPHLGLRQADGTAFATFLYFKEQPLSQDGAQVALRLMEQVMPELLPGGVPLVIDVRRSRRFQLARNRKRSRLDAWIAGEAAAFAIHWDAAA